MNDENRFVIFACVLFVCVTIIVCFCAYVITARDQFYAKQGLVQRQGTGSSGNYWTKP